MKLLSSIGIIALVFLWLCGIILNIFKPKWYWNKFIPKLHEKEEKHPGITIIVIFLFLGIMTATIVWAISQR